MRGASALLTAGWGWGAGTSGKRQPSGAAAYGRAGRQPDTCRPPRLAQASARRPLSPVSQSPRPLNGV